MHWKKSPQKVLIGFFSVASKLTGVFQDDLAITALLHDYGALAIWDYNTAAPYATIDMNPYVSKASVRNFRFIRFCFFPFLNQIGFRSKETLITCIEKTHWFSVELNLLAEDIWDALSWF